jgi:hypothetical protein
LITFVFLAAALQADAGTSARTGAPAASSPPAASANAAAKPEDDPLICRSEAVVGSRLPVRTCRHKSAWETYSRRSREAAEEVQTRAGGPTRDR